MRSPPLRLEAGQLHVVAINLQARPIHAFIRAQLVRADAPADAVQPGSAYLIAHRDFDCADMNRSALTFCVPKTDEYRIELRLLGTWRGSAGNFNSPEGFSLARPSITIGRLPEAPKNQPGLTGSDNTNLPHWSGLERWIHQRCKSSRRLNTVVSALEMRMGREELLSLPQAMSLCPTGQCNATCGFCSVTLARTGIIKKQLPLEKIRSFTAPARNTVRLYGLEGNGEPTLYRETERLIEHVLAGGADAYLITNASQFRPDLIPVLLGLESINISLNAATSETHQRVMGLKNFSAITDGIRELMRQRGPGSQHPQVSVSFVVTRDNVFEAADFLAMAEFDLGVDKILIRPLSELGNDAGSVEDFRDLVPYQSEINDLVEAVETYQAETALQRRADIVFDPENFRAVRVDPPGTGILPLDRPDEIPAPRRGHWQEFPKASTVITWTSPRDVMMRGIASDETILLQSEPIAVPPGRSLFASIRASGNADMLRLRVTDLEGRELASATQAISALEQSRNLRVQIPASQANAVRLEISHGPGAFSCTVDLGRVRKPAQPSEPQTPAPAAARWEIVGASDNMHWNGTRMHVQAAVPAGQYIAKSYSLPSRPGLTLAYPVAITVRTGRLGIGILSEDFKTWVQTFAFDPGTHETELTWNAGANTRAQFVIYPADDQSLDAEIDWAQAMAPRHFSESERAAIEANAARYELGKHHEENLFTEDGKEAHRAAMAAAKSAAKAAAQAAPSAPPPNLPPAQSGRGGSFWRLLHDPRAIYCHKPWTDLHNFTVDGRMDVCCIATGASQARFALGNLEQQNFQQVWNGPMAREFRRTVNEPGAALPPCQRCPMTRAYSGPLLEPQITLNLVLAKLHAKLQGRLSVLRRPIMGLAALVYAPVHAWLFRGFERPDFLTLLRRYRGKA